jgi:hypothetical protein
MTVAFVERNSSAARASTPAATPTKTMIASAYAAHLARRAADFGVVLEGPVRVDMKRSKRAQMLWSQSRGRDVGQDAFNRGLRGRKIRIFIRVIRGSKCIRSVHGDDDPFKNHNALDRRAVAGFG